MNYSMRAIAHERGYPDDDESIRASIKEFISIFGNSFQPYDFDSFLLALDKYEKVHSLIHNSFPNMAPWTKCDWGVNYVLNPRFFDEEMKTRLGNTMLVSALLITISASSFLGGPPGDGASSDNLVRAFSYAMYVSTMLFVLSIFFGVGFVESCLSRAYCESDRIRVTAKYYNVFGLTEVLMEIGAVILLIGLLLNSSINYHKADTIAFICIFAFAICICAKLLLDMGNETSKSQKKQTDSFIERFCKPDGSLHDELLKWLGDYDKSKSKS
jgi:hypothetical protein